MVKTPDGLRAIETLRPGELVSTLDGDTAQIRWIGSQLLPARGRFAPCVLRAPYHGAETDLIVGQDQRFCLTGSNVEYLFGHERVAAAARHLIDRRMVLPLDPKPLTQTYYQIVLDRHAVITVNGALMESLDVSALLADPGVLGHSILRNFPPELRPIETNLALPVLLGFEAMTLNEMAIA